MNHLAVIDTNVIVSAFISKNRSTPPSLIVREILGGRITPVINDSILDEYKEVLLRPKFHLIKEDVDSFIAIIKHYGYSVEPTPIEEKYSDLDDAVFFETAVSLRDARCIVITGNKRHFPDKEFILTPSEMVSILDNSK